MSRQLADGSLRLEQLETIGEKTPAVLTEFGRQLQEQYGPLTSPASQLRQKARELRALSEELDQLSEYIA